MVNSTHDIWQQFHENLRKFIAKRVRAHDIDDVLQDVFVKIHCSLTRGDVVREPTAWVHSVARSVIVDYYRKNGRDKLELDPAATEAEREDADSSDHEDSVAREELSACLHPFIDALKPDQREAITWTAIEGMTQVDAARRAGVSVSGMKSRVQRGRSALADALLECCKIEFDARNKPIGYVPRSGGSSCGDC